MRLAPTCALCALLPAICGGSALATDAGAPEPPPSHVAKPAAAKRVVAAPKAVRRAKTRAERLGLGTRAAANALFRGRPEARWVAAAGGAKDRLPGTLRWPVTKGWFVRGFGSGDGGRHLAVDIAGEIGWNVRAAADGIVAYADDGVKGYGYLVILVHSGGAITFYGHNSKLKVAAGQKVARGAVIAEVGSTGISRGPHVHFELAYDGQLCDPLPLFRPAVRHRNGRASQIEKAVWRRPAKRPASIRCLPRGASAAVERDEPAEAPDDAPDDAPVDAPDDAPGDAPESP